MPAFTIIPAIDLKDGRCVRLRQGRAEDVTVYGDDPARMARHWVDAGAKFLHVVDLDGAFDGRVRHIEQIRAIVDAAGIPVEMGGGLRTDKAIEEVLATGVRRAIIGTRALAEPEELRKMVARFGDRLAVGIDARNGFVQDARRPQHEGGCRSLRRGRLQYHCLWRCGIGGGREGARRPAPQEPGRRHRWQGAV